jgi:hypothetical protein
MTAVAWTAIGLLGSTLAVLAGAILQIGGRIDALGRDLTARIDAQCRELRERIDAQGRELSARIEDQGRLLGARIDAQSARIDVHLHRNAG